MSKPFFLLSENYLCINRIFVAAEDFKLEYGRKIWDRLAGVQQMRGADTNELRHAHIAGCLEPVWFYVHTTYPIHGSRHINCPQFNYQG
jgi:hypothetical protein